MSKIGLLATLGSLGLAIYIAQQAGAGEYKLVTAAKLGLVVSQSDNPMHPRWNPVKKETLRLVNEGIAINRHYRKITPLVGDHLAYWGDWQNATLVWESISESRPHVVVILTKIGRAYTEMGKMDKALEYLRRSQALQPDALAVRSLEVVLLSRTNPDENAARLARQYLNEQTYDYDLADAAWDLGMQRADYALAVLGMELRNKGWPNTQLDGFLKLGDIYAFYQVDEAMALGYYQAAWLLVTDKNREVVRARIPLAYRVQL